MRFQIRPQELFVDLPDLLSLEQAAEILGIGRTKKYELTSIFNSIKVGKKYKILKKELAEYIISNLKGVNDIEKQSC